MGLLSSGHDVSDDQGATPGTDESRLVDVNTASRTSQRNPQLLSETAPAADIQAHADVIVLPSFSIQFEYPSSDRTSGRINMSLVSDATEHQILTSTDLLQDLRTQEGAPFTVVTAIVIDEEDWTVGNLSIFLLGLARLWDNDRHSRCQSISIQLPTQQLDGATTLLQSTQLPLLPGYVKDVFWGGHRDLLPYFLLHQGNQISLRTLILHCEISREDCLFLLLSGRSALRKFKVHYVRDGLEQVFPYPRWEYGPTLPELVSLGIVGRECAVADIVTYHYPRLQELHISHSRRDVFKV